MPLSKYFKGSGEDVMSSMQDEYGEEKGKRVFYATVNKRKKEGRSLGEKDPTDKALDGLKKAGQ
jgi:hypothetical protein